ncbi:MAG: hypothetical protein GX444_05995 [Myxococcales bacterium]|nr:hypothetical protein [Myxococcales bacterium]
MKTRLAALALLVGLALFALLGVEGAQGELRVILLLSQRTGPTVLNKLVGDIGLAAPYEESWERKTILTKKLTPDTYTVVVKNVEACAAADCVPCPEAKREVTVTINQKTDLVFRWKAKYDRVQKKWVCE